MVVRWWPPDCVEFVFFVLVKEKKTEGFLPAWEQPPAQEYEKPF
ncbi:hypothetical protein V6N12_026621 [Hibiscus sabdariffa]|uniref:Uncharacterized protein n=1 Tax=Hibiscus sabdariffa TaxID=183260 RepID=A0ABR2DSB1_9ROSI